jgi:hypothetical protein
LNICTSRRCVVAPYSGLILFILFLDTSLYCLVFSLILGSNVCHFSADDLAFLVGDNYWLGIQIVLKFIDWSQDTTVFWFWLRTHLFDFCCGGMVVVVTTVVLVHSFMH